MNFKESHDSKKTFFGRPLQQHHLPVKKVVFWILDSLKVIQYNYESNDGDELTFPNVTPIYLQ